MADLLPGVPEDIDMEVVDVIAARLAEKLGGSVISSSLPAYVGDKIREACESGSAWWSQTIPLRGPYSLTTQWKLNPDGVVHLELTDWNGQTFWRGIFRPVPDA